MQPVHSEIPPRDASIDIQLQALRASKDSRVAVKEILGHLTIGSENYREFIHEEGVQIVMAVMRRHIRTAIIQVQALRVLTEQVESIPTFDRATLEDMAHAFAGMTLSTMRLHEGRASIQELGCRILATLAEKFRLNRDSTWVIDHVDPAFVDTILNGLWQHEAVASVQDEGCRLLDVLASNDDISYSIGAGGGIEIILAALRNHQANNRTCGLGYFALANLAKNIDNKEAIRSAGGIEFVLSDMKNDAFKVGIGYPLLDVLAENEIFSRESNGFQAILREISYAPGVSLRDPQRIQWLPFSRRSDAMSIRFIDYGVLNVIVSTIHNTDNRNKSHLIRSLAMLTTTDETASTIDERGDIDTILHILNLRFNRTHRLLLFYLSRNDEMARMMVAAGAIDLILMDGTDIAGDAMLEEFTKRMVIAGGVEFMLSILQNTPIGDERAIYHLGILAANDECANRIINAGGIEMILSRIQIAEDTRKPILIGSLRSLAANDILATEIVAAIDVKAILDFVQNPADTNKSKFIMSLGSLASNDIIATKTVAAGVINVILKRIQNADYISKALLIESLVRLAANNIIATAVVAANGMNIILACIQNADEINKSKLIESLMTLAANDTLANAIVAANGVEVILACIQNTKDSNKSKLISSLQKSAANTAIATAIVAASGIEAVFRCIDTDKLVRDNLLRILDTLAENHPIATRIVEFIVSRIQATACCNKSDLIFSLGCLAQKAKRIHEIITAESIETILSCIKKAADTDKPKLIKSLGSLARNDDIATKIVAARGIHMILSRVNRAIDSCKSELIWSLGSLATNDIIATEVVAKKGIQMILSCIQGAKDVNKSSLINCLSRLAANDIIATEMVAASGVQTILSCIHDAEDSRSSLIRSFLSLRPSDRIATEILAAGGIERILSHLEQADVFDKLEIIRSLSTLAESNVMTSMIVRRIVTAGGVECILSCLEHARDVRQCDVIPSLLRKMSGIHESAIRITQSGGIEGILSVLTRVGIDMRSQASNLIRSNCNQYLAILAQCTQCLTILARNDELANRIAQTGGIEVILSVLLSVGTDMRDHASNVIRSKCVRCLTILARTDVLANRIALTGGTEVMRLGSVQCFSILAGNEELATMTTAARRIGFLLTSMELEQNDCHIQRYGCEVLAKLALSGVPTASIVNMKGVYIIVLAMVRFADEPNVQDNGRHALALAHEADEAVMTMIRSAILDEYDRRTEKRQMTRQDAEGLTEKMILLVLGNLGYGG